MVEHLVWFKLKEGVTGAEKQAMMAALRALRGPIEGIEHIACGEDFGGRSKGFKIGLVVRFASRQALDIYQPHPVHQAFIEAHKSKWTDVMALDFEAV